MPAASPAPAALWRLSPTRSLTLDAPRLLAIINATPDSFSDGGQNLDPARAAEHAARAFEQGADAFDIGGESTRPGAAGIPDDEQIARVLPVIRAVRALPGLAGNAPITVDTTRAGVARAAFDAGADAVNDQSAGIDDPDMLPLVASRGRGIVLMHRAARPADDRYSTQYPAPPDYAPEGVVERVRAFLETRAKAALSAGVPWAAIVIDPGLGFGKSVEQNWELARTASRLLELGHPLLCAGSRKSFLAAGTNPPISPAHRVPQSVALAVSVLLQGVRLFRVHDIPEHRAALDAAAALPTGSRHS